MLPTVLAPPCAVDASALPAWRDLIGLTKPRLAFFSVLSAMTAYGTAQDDGRPVHALIVTAGAALAAGGALSFNQWWERDLDRLMSRTRARPLPRGAVSPRAALVWSLGLSAAGVSILAASGGGLAAALAAATIVLYGLIYTPLKRRTRWATEVGAVSGALPPLLGAAAAGNLAHATAAWILALILLLWQMPHFYAIGWMHRAEYRAAGFRLLPAMDRTGDRTAGWSLAYVAALLPLAAASWLLGHTGAIFGATSIAATVAFLETARKFRHATHGRDVAARRLFLASIVYLPLIMAALVLDRAL